MSFELEEKVVYRVSSAWMVHQFNCTLEHIIHNCHGCCHGTKFWPSKAFGDRCKYLGHMGCVLPINERPVTCNIFPIYVNENNVLVALHRVTTAKGMCKGAWGHGPMMWDAQKDGLIDLFGERIWTFCRGYIEKGMDPVFQVPPIAHKLLQLYDELEANNEQPRERSYYAEKI